MGYQCVRCSFPIKSLYVQYSPGNIRLMKCEKCKAVADEYIECEIMILMIDLMLHKQKAYRHLLYNVLNQQTLKFEGLHWKLAIIYFIFDACIHLYVEARNSSSLVSTCCKVSCMSSLGTSCFFWLSSLWLRYFSMHQSTSPDSMTFCSQSWYRITSRFFLLLWWSGNFRLLSSSS